MRLGVAVLTFRCGEALAPTLASISASSRQPDYLVVIDNASGDGTAAVARRLAPHADVLERASNGGYGLAMNQAVRRLAEVGCDSVVCLTHDVRLDPDCLARLEAALCDTSLGAVGPLLARVSDPGVVWSCGGNLSGRRLRPTHVASGQPVTSWIGGPQRRVTWLDGAALVIRIPAFLEVGGFRKDLFLYWEDVDLCLRLARAGWGIEIVPSALAQQEPSYTSPYLASRNKMLVLGKNHGGTVALETLGLVGRDLLTGRRTRADSSTSALRIAGLRDAFRGRLDTVAALDRGQPGPLVPYTIRVVNPLPSTLHHYQRELEEVLAAVGASARASPCASAEVGGNRGRRLLVAAWLVVSRRLDRSRQPAIVIWPVFGRGDFLTWRRGRRAAKTYLVVHDPEPLRPQLGFGSAATALGRRAARQGIRTMVHGRAASDALERRRWPTPLVLPHPMLRPVTVSDEPTIRAGLVVVGQWKPARAMGPLDALAADSRWDGVRSVYGRGWPTVAGWQVHPRFLDEAVLTRVITGAECLVLPYERYFQSGVAVRALECLTPVVGARHPFLEELLGVDWPGLVDGDDWPGAVDRVLSYDREEMTRLREAAWERCVAAWGRWAQTAFDRCPGRLGSPP